MHIEWNRVTWYSKLLAIVLFVGVFWLGFYFGHQYGFAQKTLQDNNSKENQTYPLVERQ